MTSVGYGRRRVAAAGVVLCLSLGFSAPAAAEAIAELGEILVLGRREGLQRIPGAAALVSQEDLARSQIFTVNEALRKVPGLFPREEEGAGLRPNIGLRGLNPTRSAKTLILEDGLPLGFAPYGDNATYFHPPVERYERIEVLKGSGQVAFGPQTVGGVINYVTPAPPTSSQGRLTARIGDHGFNEVQGNYGTTIDRTGLLINAMRKQSDGARENMNFTVHDLGLKLRHELSANHLLTLKASIAKEDSDITYSGLTAAEYAANPRGNPFKADHFNSERTGVSLTHGWQAAENVTLTTAFYYTRFERDWWRQSSNSAQRPNDASDPTCGGMANLLTRCGNEGRLRAYDTYGVESRLNADWTGGAITHAFELGLRLHGEEQDRRQVNGDSPYARVPGTSVNGGIREDNRRRVGALSGFIQDRMAWGALTVTPGLRVETIRFTRENRLNGATGRTSLTSLIPGLGASYELAPDWVIYGGVHKGFAPPRVEDIITAAGGAADLDAEESINWEAGVRARPAEGIDAELGLFAMDFDNQVIPASVAGGTGASLTGAGETLHQGLEAGIKAVRPWGNSTIRLSAQWTWVAMAEFRGRRLSQVPGFTNINVSGNRLPYAPEHLLNLSAGVTLPWGTEAEVSYAYTGSMFTDDLNSNNVSADGQRGQINAHGIWNLALAQPIGDQVKIQLSVKNLADTIAVADRTRGTVPIMPRLVQAGLTVDF